MSNNPSALIPVVKTTEIIPPKTLYKIKDTLIKSKDRVRDHGEVFTPGHILLFTTSSGITTQCKKFFQEDRGILKVLNFNKINDHIENNQSFWTEAWKLVQETINERINDVS